MWLRPAVSRTAACALANTTVAGEAVMSDRSKRPHLVRPFLFLRIRSVTATKRSGRILRAHSRARRELQGRRTCPASPRARDSATYGSPCRDGRRMRTRDRDGDRCSRSPSAGLRAEETRPCGSSLSASKPAGSGSVDQHVVHRVISGDLKADVVRLRGTQRKRLAGAARPISAIVAFLFARCTLRVIRSPASRPGCFFFYRYLYAITFCRCALTRLPNEKVIATVRQARHSHMYVAHRIRIAIVRARGYGRPL